MAATPISRRARSPILSSNPTSYEYKNGGELILDPSPCNYAPGALKSLSDGVTTDDIGRVIAADGKIYATAGAARNKGTTPLAMIAYVGAATCNRGLAIALNSVSDKDLSWDNSKADNNGKTAAEWISEWASTRSVSFGTWRMPTVDDCKYILQGCGGDAYSASTVHNQHLSYGSLDTKLSDCGAERFITGTCWWTSSEVDSGHAWVLYFVNSAYQAFCYFQGIFKTSTYKVRAVLAF